MNPVPFYNTQNNVQSESMIPHLKFQLRTNEDIVEKYKRNILNIIEPHQKGKMF